MSFTELPHTADVRIRITAATPDLLFEDAFLALMQTVFCKDRKGGVKRDLRIESENRESLLLDFLSEVLFICEVEGLVFLRAEVTITENVLSAKLDGEPFDRSRHSGGTEVKGISYSGLSIVKDTNGYMAEIVFDV